MRICRTGSPLALLLLAAFPHGFAQTPTSAMQAWAGWAQCTITIQGSGYSHREDHVWAVTEARPGTETWISPMTWTVTGNGSLQRASEPTTVTAKWTVNGDARESHDGFDAPSRFSDGPITVLREEL